MRTQYPPHTSLARFHWVVVVPRSNFYTLHFLFTTSMSKVDIYWIMDRVHICMEHVLFNIVILEDEMKQS